MTARELRLHLADRHDIPTRGLMYDDMLTLHDHEHRPAASSGPRPRRPPVSRPATLEWTVMVAVVLLVVSTYLAAVK